MINFSLCFTIGKAHGWGTSKIQGCLQKLLHNAPTLGLYPTQNDFESENQMEGIKKHNFY
jgi:hypothetical protein